MKVSPWIFDLKIWVYLELNNCVTTPFTILTHLLSSKYWGLNFSLNTDFHKQSVWNINWQGNPILHAFNYSEKIYYVL